MTPENEKRIKAVQAGRVPAGYKRTKVGIVPKEWDVFSLKNISTELHETAGNGRYETLSISAGVGFVNQTSKFGKDISGAQYAKYTVLKKGDFSYNKGNSKKYPQGCVYQLKDRDEAVVPNVFESFRLINGENDFFEQLFINGFLNGQLFSKINHGVRDDGLLNLRGDDFYSCQVPFPPISEQKKIAEILATQDRVIELKEKLIAEKQSQKKYLMSVLLGDDFKKPFKLNGVTIDKKKWEKKKIGDICIFRDSERRPIKEGDRKKGIYPYYGASGIIDYVEDYIFDGTFILLGEDGANIIFRSSPLAFKVEGKIWVNNHAHILVPKEGNDIDFLVNRLESLNYEKYNTGTAQPKLNQDVVEKIEIFMPTFPEQKVIAEVLSTADKEISLLQKDLEQEKLKKKSLMQLLLTGLVRVQ